jgi:hypothetical protein
MSLCLLLLAYVAAVFANQESFQIGNEAITISDDWQLLGPFQSGTREQQWGADPLEEYGGFHSLQYNPTQPFPSTLNGSVYFSRIPASAIKTRSDAIARTIEVSFPFLEWESLEKTFGWAAMQFQAWIRGRIHIQHKARYGIWIGNAVEFLVDGVYYDTGNLYETDILKYDRGGVFIDLSPGEHVLEVRVVNDIRGFGGQIPPKVLVQLVTRKVTEELVAADFDSHGGWVVPTVINMTRQKDLFKGDGCIAGEWASVALRNEGKKWIVISALRIDGDVNPAIGIVDGRISLFQPRVEISV